MYQKIEDFVICFFSFLKFLFRTFKRENFKNYILCKTINRGSCDTLYVLGNGPSLKKSIPEIKKILSIGTPNDVVMMNYSALDDDFFWIKPKYFCLSDYTFYWLSDYAKDRVVSLYASLNEKVDWNLNVYIPYRWYKDKSFMSVFKNQYLNVVPFHTLRYAGFDCFRYSLMIKNIGSADFGTVLQNAINIGIILRYKRILLYGADHSFFDGLKVDNLNRVCRVTSHYYDDNQRVEPLYHYFCSGKKTPYTMSFFLSEYATLFKGHDILRGFSEYAGVKIINKTENSFIDSYERD